MRLCAVLFLAAATLTGCVDTETYPITGEECHADDPVKELDTSDCLVPVGS